MRHHGEGYVDGIDYDHGLYRELSPAQIAFSLLLKGYRPPVVGPEGFHYAELGAGHADTSSLLAAVYPHAGFDAVDINASHIAAAHRFAKDACPGNLRLLEESFAEFAKRSDAAYDIIALHGVWSWVSAETRAILLDIVGRTLKPGGVLFLSYNALPGKAAQMDIRKILLEHSLAGTGDWPDRIGKALSFVERVVQQGARDRPETAGLVAEVERLKQRSANYIAHEYLNRDWTAFYAGDVARELTKAKLSYAAPGLMSDELGIMALPAESSALTEEADPVYRETLRDILMNRGFRRDLFVKGAERLSARERSEWLGAMRFALLVPPGDMPRAIVTSGGRLQLQKALAEPLIAALDEGPRRLDELAAMPSLAEHGWQAILQGLTLMIGTSHVAPALDEADEAACLDSVARFNAVVLEHGRMGGELRHLASPVLGNGVAVTKLDALFLLARSRGVDPVAFASDQLSALGQTIGDRTGKPLSADQRIALLREHERSFSTTRLPMLRKHRIA